LSESPLSKWLSIPIVRDCCYLVLAMLTECQLVTADQRLFKALQDGSYGTHLCWVGDLP